MLQEYLDKIAMILSTKAHKFYSFHVVVLNSRSADKDSMINSGETVAAYFSTYASWRPIPGFADRMAAAPFVTSEDRRGNVCPEGFVMFKTRRTTCKQGKFYSAPAFQRSSGTLIGMPSPAYVSWTQTKYSA